MQINGGHIMLKKARGTNQGTSYFVSSSGRSKQVTGQQRIAFYVVFSSNTTNLSYE